MKRHCLTILLFLLYSATAICQIRYGVQGSVQGSTIASTVDLTSLSPALGIMTIPISQRVGFSAGLVADVPVVNRLSIRPQLLYSVKGGDIDVGTFVNTVLTKFGLPSSTIKIENSISKVAINYIELPVLVMYGIEAGPGRLLVGAGPYAAVAIGGTLNGEPINFDTNGFHKSDFGATASLGYELGIGLTFSAYYTHGFRNFSKNATPNLAALNPANPSAALDPSAFGGTLRNRSYGFSVGYFLKARR